MEPCAARRETRRLPTKPVAPGHSGWVGDGLGRAGEPMLVVCCSHVAYLLLHRMAFDRQQ